MILQTLLQGKLVRPGNQTSPDIPLFDLLSGPPRHRIHDFRTASGVALGIGKHHESLASLDEWKFSGSFWPNYRVQEKGKNTDWRKNRRRKNIVQRFRRLLLNRRAGNKPEGIFRT